MKSRNWCAVFLIIFGLLHAVPRNASAQSQEIRTDTIKLPQAGENQSPRPVRIFDRSNAEKLKLVVQQTIKYYRDMNDTNSANKIQKWFDSGKFVLNDSDDPDTAYRLGKIYIPYNDISNAINYRNNTFNFVPIAALAGSIIHELVHAEEQSALDRSGQAFKQLVCATPQSVSNPLEVDAWARKLETLYNKAKYMKKEIDGRNISDPCQIQKESGDLKALLSEMDRFYEGDVKGKRTSSRDEIEQMQREIEKKQNELADFVYDQKKKAINSDPEVTALRDRMQQLKKQYENVAYDDYSQKKAMKDQAKSLNDILYARKKKVLNDFNKSFDQLKSISDKKAIEQLPAQSRELKKGFDEKVAAFKGTEGNVKAYCGQDYYIDINQFNNVRVIDAETRSKREEAQQQLNDMIRNAGRPMDAGEQLIYAQKMNELGKRVKEYDEKIKTGGITVEEAIRNARDISSQIEAFSKKCAEQTVSPSLQALNQLYGCLCRCTINPTIGVGATYDPKAWKNASPSCDDARYGPCVGFGLGCWREHMRNDGDCFEQCVTAASAKPQEVKAEIYKTRFKAYSDFLGEARSIIEEYLSYKAKFSLNGIEYRGSDQISGYIQLAGNFPDDASLGQVLFASAAPDRVPSAYAEMVRQKNRRGDPDRALGLVRAAETVMPDRKASGETMNILAEFAIIMAKTSLNIVTELEFDEGLYLLRKAAEFYPVPKSNPIAENIDRLTRGFEKWKEDWQTLKSQIPVCLALIKEKRVCECDRLNSGKIMPAANSLTIYEFASSEKWGIGTATGTPRPISEKDRIYNEFKEILPRAKNECANNPAMNTKEMSDLMAYDFRKSLKRSPYIDQEDLKKTGATVICDTRAVRNAEKLLSTPGLCDCQQEKIKGILDGAKKDERPLVLEFSADKKEVMLGGRVMLNLSIKGGLPPFSADMIGDYAYTQQSEARGFNINYQTGRAGANNFYVTVVDACGESGSKKIHVTVNPAKSSKKLPPAATETAQKSSPSQTSVNTKNTPPLYDPTKDPNIESSGSRNISIAQVDQLGNDFRDGTKGTRQTDQKTDNRQSPVLQPDTYTNSKKGPDTIADQGINSQPLYPPRGNGSYPMSEWTDRTRSSGDRRDRGDGSRSDNGSSRKVNCDPSKKQAAYQDGVKCGQKARQNNDKMTPACRTASEGFMNRDNQMGWGSCLYSGFDEGYRVGLGKTSGEGAGEIMAELENRSGENVHIFADGQDNFGPQNKLAPGEKRKVGIKVPKGGGYVKFIGGRNGQRLADCRWEYSPDSLGRVPVVKFSAPKNLSCTAGLR